MASVKRLGWVLVGVLVGGFGFASTVGVVRAVTASVRAARDSGLTFACVSMQSWSQYDNEALRGVAARMAAGFDGHRGAALAWRA
jgi:hypothetical protein